MISELAGSSTEVSPFAYSLTVFVSSAKTKVTLKVSCFTILLAVPLKMDPARFADVAFSVSVSSVS